MSWKAGDERHAKGLFEDPTLVEVVVLSEKHALVRGVDDQRVFGQSRFVQIVEDAADVLVDCFDAA